MPILIATARGFYGGQIIEPGTPFLFDDKDWSENEPGRPLWASLVPGEADAAPAIVEPSPPVGNGIQDALGGVQPDWISADPVPADPVGVKAKK